MREKNKEKVENAQRQMAEIIQKKTSLVKQKQEMLQQLLAMSKKPGLSVKVFPLSPYFSFFEFPGHLYFSYSLSPDCLSLFTDLTGASSAIETNHVLVVND